MRYITPLRGDSFKTRWMLVENTQMPEYHGCIIQYGYANSIDGSLDSGALHNGLSIQQIMEILEEEYEIPITSWTAIPDQIPGCRDDWIAPVRDMQDENGKTIFHRYQELVDGEWLEVRPTYL